MIPPPPHRFPTVAMDKLSPPRQRVTLPIELSDSSRVRRMARIQLLEKYGLETCENVIAMVMVMDPVFVCHVGALSQLHRSFGHLPVDRLKKSFESRTIAGPKVTPGTFKNIHKHLCDICLKAKLTRSPHQGVISIPLQAGEKFGSVCYGPMKFESLSGNRYVYGIIDYKTRRLWL